MTEVQPRHRRQMNPHLVHEAARIAAEAEATKRSLGPISRPVAAMAPELPDDLTDLNDESLTNLMVAFTRWADYSQSQLAMAEIDETAADEMLRVARAMGIIAFMPSGEALRRREESMTKAKAEVERTHDVKAFRQRWLNAYALRKMLLPRHEAFVRDAAVLSRELTRRTDRSGTERRSSTWAGAR